MDFFRGLGFLALLLGIVFGLEGWVVAKEFPTVAVVDFVSTNEPTDSALLGAADLLEAELSRYNLRVISRCEVNMLLGERGLARSGFARIEDFQGGTLPWADFLLRGEYPYRPGESAVRFSLVDAKTGTERGSWLLAVERPGELLKNLKPIIPQIVKAVSGRKLPPPRPRNQSGFTAIPEAASTFYHGMNHMVAGRPEYAAEYFRIAAADDPAFSLAVLGQAKAFEQLGFPGVGDALRATIPAAQMPKMQTAGTSSVLTVRFVNRSDVFTAGQMQRIRSILQQTHGFSLFDPDWIPALTRETDLKLSGEFPLVHGLDHRLWLRADHLLVFSAEEKGLRASVVDLARGDLLGTVQGGAVDLDGLCAQAVAIVRQPDTAVSDTLSVPVGSTNEPPVSLTGTFSVDEIAFALRHVADHPKDMACWSHLMVLIQAHSGYQTVFRAFVPYFAAAIPRGTPDTPVWLAVAGWMSCVYDGEKSLDSLPMEDYFTELLKDYPDHMQSHMVRYCTTVVPRFRGEYERCLPVIAEVEAKAAAQVATLDDFIPIRGCRIDAISQLNYNNFPNAMPPHGPRMMMVARDIYSAASRAYRETGKPEQAERCLENGRKLQGRILYGSEIRHQFAGKLTIYPTVLGLWQTGHIGYNWQPQDTNDVDRVLVGWSFMPYPLPGLKALEGVVQ